MMAISRVVSEIFNVETYNPGRSEVTESGAIRQTGCSFLLVFYSYFVPKF